MIVKRSEANPILKPNRDHSWEAEAAFNPCPIKKDGKTYLLYRALSSSHYHTFSKTKMMVSDIGIAKSDDGINFSERQRFIVPERAWDKFGCEDPRVTYLDGNYYIFYTALSQYPFRADGIKVGLAKSSDLKTLEEKRLITPFNAKGMALFPNKINGKYWAILTAHTDTPPAKMCLASFEKESDIWSEEYWNKWHMDFMSHALPLERYPQDQVEVGAPPILTKYGWLLIYSYIRNYFTPKPLFTVEAVLLNKDNPMEILARTEMPILTPEEYYEKTGIIPNVVFPTGAIVDGDFINLYYGAADTTSCMAKIELTPLLDLMLQKQKRTIKLTRLLKKPLLEPTKYTWESKAVFNPAVLYLEDKFHILYRAMSEDNTSVMGYTYSKSPKNIEYRSTQPVYTPRESFEQKKEPNTFSGCEDPRLTQYGETIYMCYTAFDGQNFPRVAFTSIKEADFLKENWNWEKPVLISPPDFDDKDAFVFPAKVNEQYMIVHRSGSDIDYAFRGNLHFDGSTWLEENRWISPRVGWWDSRKVGAAAPPVKTSDGWVMLYHGVSESNVYRIGALLLDSKNPINVIGRTDSPIFEPETHYEVTGLVPNVVFPCGNVVVNGKLYVYYGGGDRVVGVAECDINDLVRVLKICKV